jgi:hypothetical protein
MDLHLFLDLLFLFYIIHLFLYSLSFCFGSCPITVGVVLFKHLFALFLIFLILFLLELLLDVGLAVLSILGGVLVLF